MYRVMIVDDEEPVLDSFNFIFKKYVTEFTLCGQARSGTEAIKEITEKSPDLVFMDIQMPGLDGIEVIKQLRPLFPNMVFILSTAYERFDIAQKAIRLGVFSYLIKPVSRNKVLEELDKVKHYLDIRKKESAHKLEDVQLLEKTRSEMQKSFLTTLIWNNPQEKEWDEFAKVFSINCEKAAIYLIGGISHISLDMRADIFKIITQKIKYKYNCLTSELGDKLLFLFPEERDLKNLESNIRKIIGQMEKYNLILGVGSIYHYSEITKSFSEAYLPFSDEKSGSGGGDLQQRKILSLFKNILKSERAIGEDLFKEFWIHTFKMDTFPVAKGKMVALFTLLLQDIESHILLDNQFNIEPAEEIMPLESIDAWEKWAEGAMRSLFAVLDMQKNYSYPLPLNKALSFIAENYREKLSLTLVADECLVSGSYLSRLFSEHLDINFIDYLNRYRINAAVILLRDKNITIKEVTYLVGYKDPNYFSRIFRKVMGISPSDFEKRGSL
ncbi:MAG: response regulator [Spirochaetaceae bacterium]